MASGISISKIATSTLCFNIKSIATLPFSAWKTSSTFSSIKRSLAIASLSILWSSAISNFINPSPYVFFVIIVLIVVGFLVETISTLPSTAFKRSFIDFNSSPFIFSKPQPLSEKSKE